MGVKFSSFLTNQDLEVNGVEVTVGDGLVLVIARINNPNYTNHLRKISKPYQKLSGKMDIPQQEMERLTAEAASYHILKGWKNLQDDDGKEIPYSQAKAYELMIQSRDFLELVLQHATDANLYKEGIKETQSGNL